MRKLLYAGVVIACLAFVASSSAATVQIGAVAPSGTAVGDCGGCTAFQQQTDAATPSYVVPAGYTGAISSWSILDPPSSCGYCAGTSIVRLRVFRPTSPTTYTLVGESVDETLPNDGAVHTFTTSIAVKPGDVIGIRSSVSGPNVVIHYASTHADDVEGDVIGDPSLGATIGGVAYPYEYTDNLLLNVAATVQTPVAAFVAPASSATTGQPVAFDASPSTSGATITDYSWNFGDGQTLDAQGTPATSHTYTTAGTFNVTLTITDSDGNTATVTHAVTVVLPTFAGSSLGATSLTAAKNGSVALSLACSSTAFQQCSDSAALYGSSGTLPASMSRAHPKPAKLLGSASVTIASGATIVEQLTLNKAGRKLLRKHRHFKARLILAATDNAARTFTSTVQVTVTRARPHAAAFQPLVAKVLELF
jgi:PKD repeat protein